MHVLAPCKGLIASFSILFKVLSAYCDLQYGVSQYKFTQKSKIVRAKLKWIFALDRVASNFGYFGQNERGNTF